MITRVVLAAAASSLLLAGPAPAQPMQPVSPDQCLDTAAAIADEVDQKELSNDEADLLEQLIERMEHHCEAMEFAEAMTVYDELKALLDSLN